VNDPVDDLVACHTAANELWDKLALEIEASAFTVATFTGHRFKEPIADEPIIVESSK
jgi:hypothetical protein